MERKLAAILAADVVGYSRLMEVDEAGTLAALKARRKEILEPLVAKHRGRVVKLMGDGVLIEFASAVNAVECAAALQRAMVSKNASMPENKRILLRVGINLGDVIVEGTDIYGDGVNIAARLEALTEPSGICVSGKVRDEVARKLDLAFEDLGLRELKNIATPVRVYRVRTDAPTPKREAEATPLPSKPSIVVLPFTNISGDPEQEYFSNGVTEDIITALSRLRWLDVIARNTAFAHGREATNPHELRHTLAVQYVLSGSVRRSGRRMRITAHLVEAETGKQVWSDRFDSELEDIFAVQDQITQLIVAALPGRIEAAGLERARRKPTDNLAAYEYLLRGKHHHHRGTRDDNVVALELLDKAIELDPNSAQAHAWKACTLGQALVRGYLDPDAAWKRMVAEVQESLALDEDDFECHRLLAEIHLIRRQHDRAWFHHERAFELNPNDPRILSQRGEFLTWAGRPAEGVPCLQLALRLDPYQPDGRLSHLGVALHAAHRYEDAVGVFRKVATLEYRHHAYLASCHAQMGLEADARRHADEVLRLMPDFDATRYIQGLPYQHESDRQRFLDSLTKAGLSGQAASDSQIDEEASVRAAAEHRIL